MIDTHVYPNCLLNNCKKVSSESQDVESPETDHRAWITGEKSLISLVEHYGGVNPEREQEHHKKVKIYAWRGEKIKTA